MLVTPKYKNLKESDIYGPWTAITDKTNFGAGMVTILSPTKMKFEYYRTDTKEIYDTVLITK